jgi:CheY-like chemotaxis protein
MVYGFVKQSDGHIKIYSEPDHGTTIRIYLPRVQAPEDVTPEVDTGPAIGGSETVLVVEDDEAVRRTVVDLLTELGYRVLKARDADSALSIIDSGVAIDLLFTDVVMPGALRSPELARQARLRLPDIAVLFTSGYTNNAIVHGGRLDHGLDLLSKPYSREALARKIRHVLRNRRQRAVVAPASPRPVAAGPDGLAATRLRILLVEDDGLIRMVTTEMLEGLGHSVIEAADATEALRVLDQEPVDLMITDVGLPDMPGNRLAVEAVRVRPDLKIVFATGAGSDRMPGTAGADGGAPDGVPTITKPYGLAALESVLRTVCSRRCASDPTPPG